MGARDGSDSPWHLLAKRHLQPARDLADKKVLEIGCGRGGFTCWLAGLPSVPAEIVACDFSATALVKAAAMAAALGLERIHWQWADIQNIPFADHSFDTVVSCETIEHVPDPGRAVQELARVLRPRGRLLLTTPNYFGTLGLYRLYLALRGREFTEVGQPLNNFMLLPWTARLIARAGLRVQVIDGIGHYLPWPGRPPVKLRWLDNPRPLMRWFANHSLVVGEKHYRSAQGR